jgi:arginine N-succinyltransferase
MIIFRPIAEGDLSSYIKLAFASHINFYTLPKSEKMLKEQFELALRSFTDGDPKPKDQYYLFVAEDLETKKLVGVSAISATSGDDGPQYFFRKEVIKNTSKINQVVKELPVLNPVSYLHGPSEVCSLFVDPASRGAGVGKLLSLARFVFVSRFPERFTGSFIAELRGKLVDGISPFWESVGQHFFHAAFEEVQEMLNYSRQFIAEFLPQYPLYIDLLPYSVQAVIGKVDVETEAAFSLLQRLGFELTQEIDVIDGGPKLIARKESIKPVIGAHTVQVQNIDVVAPTEHQYIIGNERLDFRAILAPLRRLSETHAQISPEVARILNIDVGDPIRIFNPKSI